MLWAWLMGAGWAQTCAVVELEPVSETDKDAAAQVYSELRLGLEGGCASVIPFRREQADCGTDEACLRGVLGEYDVDVVVAGTVQLNENAYFVALRVVGRDDAIWWSQEVPPMATMGIAATLLDELEASAWLKAPDVDPEPIVELEPSEPSEPAAPPVEPEASATRQIVRIVGGVSRWQLPGAEGGLELGFHVAPAIRLELEAGAIYGRKSATHSAEVHDVLLLPAAFGVGVDPASDRKVHPSIALLGTATLYSLQPRVSPGFKVRPALDFVLDNGFGWSVEAFGGLGIAPGIDTAIDPDFTELAPLLGARMGIVVRT